MVLLEETGRSLFPSPLLATTLAARVLAEAGSAEQHARWLPGLADGTRIGTLAVLEESDLLTPEGIELEGQPDGDAASDSRARSSMFPMPAMRISSS